MMVHSGQLVSTFNERFSELLSDQPGSATALADKMHVSKQTISAWKLGVRHPSRITTIAVARFFGVNIDWLYGYDVEKEAKQEKMPENVIPISQSAIQRIPLIGSVAAGQPILAGESYDVFVDSPVKADYALRVTGNSMEPTYYSDDILYIRQTPDVPDGKIAIVLIDDEACVKHVYHIPNGVMLTSDNPAYQPMTFTWPEHDTIRVLGAVVGFTRMYK